jgi:hypothetical protein
MKKLLIAILIVPFCAFAADKAPKPEKADKYQVTGSVSEVSDAKIVVMKGTERFEVVRNADTKVDGGELKVGSKVTVKYVMTATSVEVKADEKKPEKKEAAKPTAPAVKK